MTQRIVDGINKWWHVVVLVATLIWVASAYKRDFDTRIPQIERRIEKTDEVLSRKEDREDSENMRSMLLQINERTASIEAKLDMILQRRIVLQRGE